MKTSLLTLALLLFAAVANAHHESFKCITALGQSLAGLTTKAPDISSSWKEASASNNLSENSELIIKIEKQVRNAFLLERIKSRNQEAPLSDLNNQGLLLDAAKNTHLSNYDAKDVLEFVVQYNNLNRQKDGVVNRAETSAQQRALLKLIQKLNEGEFLKPTVILTLKSPTLIEELQAVLSGEALIQIGSHDLTVKSFEKAIQIQNLMNKEMQHMADTSLSGANKYVEIADHIRLAFKNSQDLLATLLIKLQILGATHPNLEKAVVSMLHHHLVDNGNLIKKLSSWSLTKKVKNDFEFFPVHQNVYEYTRRAKDSAAQLTMDDFIIAREWLVQELTREN